MEHTEEPRYPPQVLSFSWLRSFAVELASRQAAQPLVAAQKHPTHHPLQFKLDMKGGCSWLDNGKGNWHVPIKHVDGRIQGERLSVQLAQWWFQGA